MRLLYWLSAVTVLYVYAGYPVLLAVWARLRSRPRQAQRTAEAEPAFPSVSIVLAARDEGHRLAARLENLLGLDYPAARREIVVVSDGSRDQTEEVLRRYRGRVVAVLLPVAEGKAAALNAGVRTARNEILVFADARQRFASDALRRLVEPFSDPQVGGVSGELLLDEGDAGGAGEGESAVGEGVGLYWRYEKWLRQRESEVGSTLGATGAIYAMRRQVWRPLPPQALLDDVLAPMRAVLDGYRVVFEPGAKAYDRSSPDAQTEMRRKVRTLAGNYQLLRLEPRLLLPVVNPVWLQFASHKLGRLVVPYALIAFLLSNVALAASGVFYGLTLTLQVGFYVLATHGAIVALARDGTERAVEPSPGLSRAGAAPSSASPSPSEATGGKRQKGVGECAA